MSADEFLGASGGSWPIGRRPATGALVDALRAAGWRAVTVAGKRCPSKATLLAEIADALALPNWFGHNWDALVDCLREAAGGQPLALIVTAAAQVGHDEPGSPVLATLTSIVDDLAADGVPIKLATR